MLKLYFFGFTYHKYPGDIKSKMYAAILPGTIGFGNIGAFRHPGRIGQVNLEHMPAGFNFVANGK